ncbi:MAG: ATP-binding protein [Candidatus Micrarchaeota archaeon]|nr:ATP-binding protein [Candidatus Micrarchaeota archaeon]
MAEIRINGNLKIIPTGTPKAVVAGRDLKVIEDRLRLFQRKFANCPLQSSEIRKLGSEMEGIRIDYLETLQLCSDALEKEVAGMSKENKRYYSHVLTFLSRANDAHTIIPFDKHITAYITRLQTCEARLGGEPVPSNAMEPYFGTFAKMKGFVEARIVASIEICRGYIALLTNSMNSSIEAIDIGALIYSALNSQKDASRVRIGTPGNKGEDFFKREIEKKRREFEAAGKDLGGKDNLEWNTVNDVLEKRQDMIVKKENDKLRKLYNKNVEFDLSNPGVVYNILPLARFAIENVIQNLFKASFTAYLDNVKFIGREYQNAAIQKPKVKVSCTRKDAGTVVVRMEDNGIGITMERLGKVIARGVFKNYVA